VLSTTKKIKAELFWDYNRDCFCSVCKKTWTPFNSRTSKNFKMYQLSTNKKMLQNVCLLQKVQVH
jgi:hypothetical protein